MKNNLNIPFCTTALSYYLDLFTSLNHNQQPITKLLVQKSWFVHSNQYLAMVKCFLVSLIVYPLV